MKSKTGREFVVYPPFDNKEIIISSEDIHAAYHRQNERLKYYEKLEKVLGLEEGILNKPVKDFSDAWYESIMKVYSNHKILP